jgi:hypothetical protein
MGCAPPQQQGTKLMSSTPLPLGQDTQIGTPLYNWAYTGTGDESATFGITAGEGMNFTKVTRVLVTLGSFTANTQKFFQYYYQVTYKSPASGGRSLYAVGFIPADKLSRFFATNLDFNQTESGPV